jgi:hypothetical protein
VFVRPALTIHRDRPDTVMTFGETAKSTAAPTESGVVMLYTDPNGRTTTIRPSASICAYPPGTPLPAYLSGVTPDLIMP